MIGKGSSGVMYGLYHLEKLFDFRGAPILKKGDIAREPVFRERLTNTVFSPIWEDPGDKDAYPDGYLSRISHFGYNGIFLYSNLYEYFATLSVREEILGFRNAFSDDKISLRSSILSKM